MSKPKPLTKEQRRKILDEWGANVDDADMLINEAKSLARYEATVTDLEQRLAVAVEAIRGIQLSAAPGLTHDGAKEAVRRVQWRCDMALSRINGKE